MGTSILIKIKKRNDDISDCVIYDIDQRQFIGDLNSYRFPDKSKNKLINELNEIYDSLSKTIIGAKNCKEKELAQESYWTKATLRVKQVFFNFFLNLIGPYHHFCNENNITSSINNNFQFSHYFESFQNIDHREYIKKFAQTQFFTNFIESSISNKNINIQFFQRNSRFLASTSMSELRHHQEKHIEKYIQKLEEVHLISQFVFI